ncbi:MAG: hypothetical protein V1798_11215 [Pseudomonadota bacterium]
MSGPRRITFTGLVLFLLLASALYASYKYVPLMWKKMQLESVVKEESYARRKTPEEVAKAIVTAAQTQLGIELKEEDVEVQQEPGRTRINVTWRPAIPLLFGQSISYAFHVKVETVSY